MSGAREAEDQASPLIYSVRARATGLPSTDELLATISERVPDASIFEQHPPVFMRAEASNRNLDAYFTRMAPSTLQNYATDASDGVSFLNSHNMRSLGFGQTFAGRYVAGGQQRTDIDFYVMRGLKLNETSNDDFIAAVSGGSIKDVSVGFIPGATGWYRCGICDARMERWWGMFIPTCGHWPGDDYPVDPKDESKGTRTAFAWVEEHHLAELSAVNDGATPGAGIKEVKARQLIASGEMPRETAERIARRYGIDLPTLPVVVPVAEIPAPQQEERMEGLTPEETAAVRLALTDAGAAPDAAIPGTIRSLVDELKGLRALPAEVERLTTENAELPDLRKLAETGRQYRADLVEAALTEGKRARGVEFDEATYRSLLEAAPIDVVKRMRDDWSKDAERLFPGGRKTVDGGEPTPITERTRRPAAAYS